MGGEQSGIRSYDEVEIAFIQHYTNEGFAASEIAALFSDKFKRLVSRNSIISLWTRGRIARDPENKRVVVDVSKPPRPKRNHKRQKNPSPIALARIDRARAAKVLQAADHWKPLEGVEPASLINRTGCKWPLNMRDEYGIYMFCNAPREYDGARYCPTHSQLSYRPARVR